MLLGYRTHVNEASIESCNSAICLCTGYSADIEVKVDELDRVKDGAFQINTREGQ